MLALKELFSLFEWLREIQTVQPLLPAAILLFSYPSLPQSFFSRVFSSKFLTTLYL